MAATTPHFFPQGLEVVLKDKFKMRHISPTVCQAVCLPAKLERQPKNSNKNTNQQNHSWCCCCCSMSPHRNAWKSFAMKVEKPDSRLLPLLLVVGWLLSLSLSLPVGVVFDWRLSNISAMAGNEDGNNDVKMLFTNIFIIVIKSQLKICCFFFFLLQRKHWTRQLRESVLVFRRVCTLLIVTCNKLVACLHHYRNFNTIACWGSRSSTTTKNNVNLLFGNLFAHVCVCVFVRVCNWSPVAFTFLHLQAGANSNFYEV